MIPPFHFPSRIRSYHHPLSGIRDKTFSLLYDPYHLANLLSYAHPPHFYPDRKVQTIKDLEKPWAALMPRRLRPDPRLQPTSSSSIWTGHSAATTLLLDDSPAKAVLQPHNQLCVPEYTRTLRNVDLSVLQLERVVQQLQQQQQQPSSSVSHQEDPPATAAATTSTNTHEHAVSSPDAGTTTEQQQPHPSDSDQKDSPATADATTDANAREHAVLSLDGTVAATEQPQPSSVSHQEDSAVTAAATTSTNNHERAVSSPDGTGTTTEQQQQPSSVLHQEDSPAPAAAETTTNAYERAFSSPEGSGTSTEQEQVHNKRKRKKTKRKKDNTQALALQQQQLLAAISADGASPAVFDETLLAVIGILHAARLQSSIAGWLRAGALFSPPSSERASVMGVNDKVWCNDPVLVRAWASRGREAMRELGLKVEHGIES